jgi:predicted Zn-ribbon and HTH transcriptional regulator
MTKNPQMIHSLQTGIQIIELIAKQEHPLKFTEIQELSGLTKSNLYKCLNTLPMAVSRSKTRNFFFRQQTD